MKILLIATFVIPWLTLFFSNKSTVKRYMPVTIFTSLLMTIIFEIAYQYKWWIIHEYLVPWGYMIDIGFAYGIFAIGTFWIFVLASHKFWIYFLANLGMDLFMAFAGMKLLDVFGVATLKNIEAWQYFLVMFGISLVIYGYHLWQRKIFIDIKD